MREPHRDLPRAAGIAKRASAHDGSDGAYLVTQLAAYRVGHDAAEADARGENARLVDAVVALELCEQDTHEGDVSSVVIWPASGAEPIC